MTCLLLCGLDSVGDSDCAVSSFSTMDSTKTRVGITNQNLFHETKQKVQQKKKKVIYLIYNKTRKKWWCVTIIWLCVCKSLMACFNNWLRECMQCSKWIVCEAGCSPPEHPTWIHAAGASCFTCLTSNLNPVCDSFHGHKHGLCYSPMSCPSIWTT